MRRCCGMRSCGAAPCPPVWRRATRCAWRRATACTARRHRGAAARMAEASYPEDLLYHPEHDWARVEGEQATLGITWFAQDALGEVVFFEPPAVGTSVAKDAAYTEVESVKAVSDVIAPLSGEIVEVNGAL